MNVLIEVLSTIVMLACLDQVYFNFFLWASITILPMLEHKPKYSLGPSSIFDVQAKNTICTIN